MAHVMDKSTRGRMLRGGRNLRNQTDSDMKCVRGVQQEETNRGLEGSPETRCKDSAAWGFGERGFGEAW